MSCGSTCLADCLNDSHVSALLVEPRVHFARGDPGKCHQEPIVNVPGRRVGFVEVSYQLSGVRVLTPNRTLHPGIMHTW